MNLQDANGNAPLQAWLAARRAAVADDPKQRNGGPSQQARVNRTSSKSVQRMRQVRVNSFDTHQAIV